MLVQSDSTNLSQPIVVVQPCAGRRVTLADGTTMDLAGMNLQQLDLLQCQQEPLFAKAIANSSKDSLQRQQIIQTAYATVCAILDEQSQHQQKDGVFSMGMDPRYAELVLQVLQQQSERGVDGGLFELGCSAGALLGQADRAGYRVGGLEVVPELLHRAKQQLKVENHSNLFLGDFRKLDMNSIGQSYSVAYWNDVFEHIPTDEIREYLQGLYSILKPGGKLITITPNWHMRPSDVTMKFRPPRSEAEGFHLKEYTLREVTQLLKQVGFDHVTTPCWISRQRIYVNQWFHLTSAKCFLEGCLEWLPYNLAVQVCRRFGFNCTIASKPVNR